MSENTNFEAYEEDAKEFNKAYIASLDPDIRALHYISDAEFRIRRADELARLGRKLHIEIDVHGSNPFWSMWNDLRQGWEYTPVWGSEVPTAPGASGLPVLSYKLWLANQQALGFPAAIRTSIDPADFPPFSQPETEPERPAETTGPGRYMDTEKTRRALKAGNTSSHGDEWTDPSDGSVWVCAVYHTPFGSSGGWYLKGTDPI